jgi:FxsC-like protein
MSYDFFFSYTRGNYGEYLQKFFDDLSQELREQRGYGKAEVVGFFDQHDIELGEEWEKTIAQALQESKVMVCIYSPGYFKSSYCGKEWEVFQQRRNAYLKERKAAGEKVPSLPPVIKPVFWLAPLPSNLNEAIKATHYIRGNPADYHNQNGLKYVLQKLNDCNSMYIDYIKKLATEIREAADHYKLPQLNPLPPLKQVESAFIPKEAPQAAALGGAPGDSHAVIGRVPQHVRFVFVAGDPREFGNLRSAAPYLETGGHDWRPFPGMSRIGPYVQHLVSDEELDFDSDELTLSDDLIHEIEKAYQERKIVIILVDGWTLNWKIEYQNILKKLDQETKPFINCSVLVPWNDQDPDILTQQTLIEQTIKSTFDFRANLWKNPIFYRDSIRSIDELRDALREILTNIKAEMHKRAEGGKTVPSQIFKPIISNQ